MKLATLEETITVTQSGAARRLTSSQVAGNIDRRQMAELPLQGRNWQELSLMVKGVTANNVTNTPGAADDQFQLNLDGQQITQRVAGSGFGQPKVSREAIAEFQIVTNMFDITQGRSTGMQVQAISRSGTNDLRGSAYGFFRSDALQRRRPGHRARCCRSRTSRRAARSAVRSCRTRCTSSGRTSTSGSPPTPSWRRPGSRTRPSSSRPSRSTRTISAGSTISSRRTTPSRVRGQHWAFNEPVLDLRAARRIRRRQTI